MKDSTIKLVFNGELQMHKLPSQRIQEEVEFLGEEVLAIAKRFACKDNKTNEILLAKTRGVLLPHEAAIRIVETSDAEIITKILYTENFSNKLDLIIRLHNLAIKLYNEELEEEYYEELGEQ